MVIADRFLFTALARDVARGLDLDWVLNLYQPLLWPDLVFYFAVSPTTSSARVSAVRTPNYYAAGQDVTLVENPTESYAWARRPESRPIAAREVDHLRA